MQTYWGVYSSPVGPLYMIVDDNGALVELGFGDAPPQHAPAGPTANAVACRAVERQLADYFGGRLRSFTIAIAPVGTPFQQAVWQHLLEIPFGSTDTYGQIAQAIGHASAARAVGNAVANNPLAIVIPCHRVLPQSGRVGNYATHSLGAGGSAVKRQLLDLEGVQSA